MATDVPTSSPSALRHPGSRWFVATDAIAMMADHVEHVIVPFDGDPSNLTVR